MAGIVSLLSQVFAPVQQPAVSPVHVRTRSPYDNNPFVNYNGNSYTAEKYGKNRPVKGGYFAGYYNGKQNIVGQRLFVEV